MKYTKEIKAGALVVITLVAFFILFNFLKGRNLFISGRVFYAKYEDIGGLEKSKPVSVNGLRVGSVNEIKIIDDARPIYFVVKMTVDRDIQFSKNTIARIADSGPLSGREIHLQLDYDGAIAESGDTIVGNTASSLTSLLSEQIGPTKNNLDSLLVSLNKTSNNLQKLMDDENTDNIKHILRNLNGTLTSFQQTTASLSRTSDNASRLIADNNGKLGAVLDNANQSFNGVDNTLTSTGELMDEAKTTIKKYGDLADKFNQIEFENTLKNLESSSKKLDELLTKIQSDEGTLGALMNDRSMYNNLNETSVALKELMQDFKENPKNYVHFSVFGKRDKKKDKTEN